MTPGVEHHWFATEGTGCPLCGRRLRRTPDVLDELVECVVNEAGSVPLTRRSYPQGEADDRISSREHEKRATCRCDA